MTEKILCTICGSSNYELLSKKGQFKIPLNVVICKECGLVYLNPRWSKVDYLNFYQNEYDRYYRPHILNPASTADKNSINPIIERLKRNNLLPENTAAILDIGSGEGRNLSDFSQSFPDAAFYAIEPSKHSCKVLLEKGYHVIAEDVESNWEKEYKERFEIIIMRHVLEHFLDPLAVLKKVRSVLKEGGLIYLAVPNCLKPTGLLQSYWFRVVHTYYFNKFSLINILNKAGLSPIKLTEGDEFNKGEIFLFAGKSTVQVDAPVSREHYIIQKKILAAKIKEENSLSHKLKSLRPLLSSFKKRVKSFLIKKRRS